MLPQGKQELETQSVLSDGTVLPETKYTMESTAPVHIVQRRELCVSVRSFDLPLRDS